MAKECLNCGSEILREPHKKEKVFCNSSCRSNYWQKTKKLEKEGLSVDEILKRIKKTAKKRKVKITDLSKPTNVKKPKEQEKTNYSINTGKHPLWKEGDPSEGSMSFYLKYEAYSYKELENKLKQ